MTLIKLNQILNRTIGMDCLFDVDFSTSSFPPYNLYEENGNVIIEMALAGYSKDRINIEVVKNLLTISAKPDDKQDKQYVHQGLSNRRFKTSFALGQHSKVIDANMSEGILRITVQNVVPKPDLPKQIQIN